MNSNNSFNTNYVHGDNNVLFKSPSSHNTSCDKDNKMKQFIVYNSAQHSTSVTNYNTPTNQLSPSSSHKVLFTRINYKNKLHHAKYGWELPFIENNKVGGSGVGGSSLYKRYFSQRKSNLHNNSNSNTIQSDINNIQQRKYHFKTFLFFSLKSSQFS